MNSNFPQTVKCVHSRLDSPGALIMKMLRLRVLEFAQSKKWIITGGWAHHFALLFASGKEMIYDTQWACTMGDVDALAIDPLSNLIELALLLNKETGIEFIINNGMNPNIFHLAINWGGETLVDLVAIPSSITFSIIPTISNKVTIIDPLYELANLHAIVNNAFAIKDDDMLSKYMSRISYLQGIILFKKTKHTKPKSNTKKTKDSYKISWIDAFLTNTARVPGIPFDPPEVLVYAGDFIDIIFNIALHDKTMELKIYTAFIWTMTYSFVAEFTSPKSQQVVVRLYCIPTPVPCITTTTSTLKFVTSRFAARHLMTSSLWLLAMGDLKGSSRHNEAAVDIMCKLAKTQDEQVISQEYCGAVMFEPLWQRYMKRRASGKDQKLKMIVKNGSVRHPPQKVKYMMFDGRLRAQHRCGDVTTSKNTFTNILRNVVEDTVMTNALITSKTKYTARGPQRWPL